MRICNDRMKDMPFGGLFEISMKADELERQGRKIIHMEIGRPDYDSPIIAKDASKSALDQAKVHYTNMNGIYDLRKAISEKEKRRFNLEYDPHDEITVTMGASEALLSTMLSYMNPGEEIIIPSPYFSLYNEQAIVAGIKIVKHPLTAQDHWALRVEDIEKKITDKTKAILINSPNNPVGYVINPAELKKIADLAKEYDLLVISDECYDEFLYDGDHISIANLPGMKERTVVIKSTSKSFAMTGWRIGYAMGPKEIIKYVGKVHHNMSTCCNSFAQWGAIKAFTECDEFTDEMRTEFKRRRDKFYEILSNIKGLKIAKPKGAFYMYPEVSALGMTDKEFCKYILDESGVVGVPGSAFSSTDGNYIRLAYCRSMEEIQAAGEGIRRAVEKLS